MVSTVAVQVAELVQAAATGEEAAFTELLARYHRDLLRVAYVICREPALAEDAAPAAWAIAWRRIGDVKDPTQIRGWLVADRKRGPPDDALAPADRLRDLGRNHGARLGTRRPLGPTGRQHREVRPAPGPRVTRSERPRPDRPSLRVLATDRDGHTGFWTSDGPAELPMSAQLHGTVAAGPLGLVSIGDGQVLVSRDGVDSKVSSIPPQMADPDNGGGGSTVVAVGERTVLVLMQSLWLGTFAP
jgi:hypothetical protein